MIMKEDVFDSRVSDQSYSDRPVDEETVDLLLKCATTAPSNRNMPLGIHCCEN
ncbi:hypothetical protein ACFQ3N_11240 [Virgibacillus byunsanensis]|uniref:Nitroreductase domain-containing protein n=1 Tax=Virgibacillus byunsanensis TaxID=570945 RepID=A0ABW3LLK9_9BACI